MRPLFLFKLIVGIVVVILVALFAVDSYFVVEPTEMAGVRRLGQVITTKPLGPGPHFKLPLIDQVDRLPVALDTFNLAKLTLTTIYNHPISGAGRLTTRSRPPARLRRLSQSRPAGTSTP